jgi:transcriptional regulatory protein RtcR
VYNGGFREDLLARINLWTFQLPGLKDRRADIEPNLDYELERYARETGDRITFNREARQRYLQFALAPAAAWRANFRDLSASVTRLATLAPGGRITLELVAEEITRLQASWHATTTPGDADPVASLLPEDIDLFERTQLLEVIRVCRASRSQSEAGRRLFAVSRQKKDNPNDADRLRKYLSRFGLNWQLIVDTPE